MSLFNLIVNALDNPEQEASTGQLGEIMNTVKQVSNTAHTSSSSVESAMSILGKYTKSALQDKRNQEGEGSVQQIINQFAGTQSSNQVVSTLFSNNQLGQIFAEIEDRTGINQDTLKSMIPLLLPLVLNLLKTGNRSSNEPNQNNNSVLSGFLDTDGDGHVDIADALSLASKYL